MKSKKIVSILILIVILLGFSTISNAALESKAGQSSWKEYANSVFVNVREMEKSGGTLGQNAVIDETTYLDSSKNGIDVHMALATEWGGVAILAVSDYGNFNTNSTVSDAGTNVAATTGNITGVFQMADDRAEYVAGLLKNSSNNDTSVIYSADSRYRNEYTTTASEYHKGDAIYQTEGWYNSNDHAYVTSGEPLFCRYKYQLFGFRRTSGWWYDGVGGCRAVVTCGENL